jgi:hypothetical protein
MAIAAALAGLALGAGAAQAANPACNWYVQTSAKQQQENMRKGCNFRGAEWSSDVSAHAAFCERNAPEVWKGVAQRRQKQLEGCKGR